MEKILFLLVLRKLMKEQLFKHLMITHFLDDTYAKEWEFL